MQNMFKPHGSCNHSKFPTLRLDSSNIPDVTKPNCFNWNGLIFYANVIRAQHATFFTPDISNSFLSMFIAWLNLDQGIESCLYDGLDTYTSTWLQFLFPLYIWLLAAVLIVLSHYSTRVSKLMGKNAVPVLATLFLISYTKVLRLILDVTSFTVITYPNGYKKTASVAN